LKIRAAVAREPHVPLRVESIEIEAPREGEILVKVVATGVCHTDISVRDGLLPTPLPAVLGHEGAGVVEAIGEGVSSVAPGDHVVMTYNSCGVCPSCSDDAASFCYEFSARNFLANRPDGSSALSSDGSPLNGNFFGQSSFAERAICHEANVVKVPHDVSLEMLGPLACGIQTGAGAVLNALRVTPGSSFAVFGAGSVGLSAVMAAKLAGAAIIVAVDLNARRLDVAKELGATHVIRGGTDAVAKLVSIARHGFDFTLDTTALPAVIRSAVDALAPRGVCAILGATGTETEMTLNEMHFMTGGRRLIGTVEGNAHSKTFIPALIEHYRAGTFPFDKLIRYYSIDQINEAIADSEAGVAIKPVVRFA